MVGIAVGVLIGIAVAALIIGWVRIGFKKRASLRKSRLSAEETNETVAVALSTRAGDLEAQGTLDEFVITVENRYEYLVRNGIIVASKDRAKSNFFKDYAEVK